MAYNFTYHQLVRSIGLKALSRTSAGLSHFATAAASLFLLSTCILPFSPRQNPELKMGDQTIQPTPESPEIIAFATRMYDAARQGDIPIFEQALPAGLPPNMTNDKGDSLVRSSPRSLMTRHLSTPSSCSSPITSYQEP